MKKNRNKITKIRTNIKIKEYRKIKKENKSTKNKSKNLPINVYLSLGQSYSPSSDKNQKVKNQTKVLLVTGHRTGSTFISELFNQNNNAFYLFEPLGPELQKTT